MTEHLEVTVSKYFGPAGNSSFLVICQSPWTAFKMLNQDFPFTCDLSEKHVHKITFKTLLTILPDWQNFMGWSFQPNHYKVMIQLWNSLELFMNATDINTWSHGISSLSVTWGEKWGWKVLFSLKSTYISLTLVSW